jgi:hypothetical protein
MARKQILDILLSADDSADAESSSDYHHEVDTARVAHYAKGFSGRYRDTSTYSKLQ